MKETDRIAAIAHNLRVMGAQVIEMNDGLEIHGPLLCAGADSPASAIIALPWLSPLPGFLPTAKQSFRTSMRPRFVSGFSKSLEEFINPNGSADHAGHRFSCSYDASKNNSHRVIASMAPPPPAKAAWPVSSRRLSVLPTSSGAMYRAVTWYVLLKKESIPMDRGAGIACLIEKAPLSFAIFCAASNRRF